MNTADGSLVSSCQASAHPCQQSRPHHARPVVPAGFVRPGQIQGSQAGLQQEIEELSLRRSTPRSQSTRLPPERQAPAAAQPARQPPGTPKGQGQYCSTASQAHA